MHVVLIKSDPKAREKPCLRCGYSLRKILDSKYCPECGLSVWLSLNPNDALDWSNPAWLRRLSLASWFLAVAQLLGIVAYALICWDGIHIAQRMSAAFAAAAAASGNSATAPAPVPWLYTFRLTIDTPATRLCGGIYLLLFGAGQLLLAADEGRHPDKWLNYRWACRITGVVGMLVGVFVLLSGGEFLFKLALMAGTLSTFAYLRKLAQRIPHSLLMRICGIVLLGPLVTLLKTVPFFWFFAVSELLNLVEYLPLVYLPVTAVLLVRFAVLLRRSGVAATEGWANESAPEGAHPTAQA
jgi:hypothetical protein